MTDEIDDRYWTVTNRAVRTFEETLDGKLIHYVLSTPSNDSTTKRFWGAWDMTSGLPVCIRGTAWTRLDMIRNEVRKDFG